MKIRMKSAIGFAPTAAAPGDNTATGSAGSALDVADADLAPAEPTPNSRRDAANAAHANGPAAGTSPPLPAPNHDSRPRPSPDTAPVEALVSAGASTAPGDTGGVTEATTTGATATAGAGRSLAVKSADAAGASVTPDRAGARTAPSSDGSDCEPTPPDDGTGGVTDGVPASSAPVRFRRGTTTSALSDPRPPRARGVGSESGSVPVPAPPEEDPSPRPARDPRCEVDFGLSTDDAASAALEVEPAEPVVSANPKAGDATAEPTPRATARAPTRPT